MNKYQPVDACFYQLQCTLDVELSFNQPIISCKLTAASIAETPDTGICLPQAVLLPAVSETCPK